MRNPFLQVALWTLALGTALAALVLTVPWLPEDDATQAGPIDTLYDVLSVLSAYIFALVVSVLLVAVVHFRRRHNDPSDGRPIHGNSRLEVVWTAIPAILMIGAAVYSGLVLRDIEESKAGTQNIHVVAQQFAWAFQYEQPRLKSAELHLVEDTPYLFEMDSKDVIHSFWVPEFRMKRDLVPGITTKLRITPEKPGRFALACTELCGLGHSTMRARVIVETQASFDRWAAKQRRQQNLVGGLIE
jgi:cytochrome c oxidase subunit II